jgi:hypothetical protein
MGEPQPKSQPVLPEWIKKNLAAIVVAVIATVLGGVILYFLLGSEGSSSPPQVVVSGSNTTEESAEPENFSEAVDQRPFWTSPPFLTEEADPEREEGGVPFSSGNLDVVVTSPKALVESPGYHESGDIILVARVVEQQEVSGEFIEQEIRMESAKPYFDLYVVPSNYDIVLTGDIALIVGRLAAVGYSEDPSGHRHRTAYIDARGGRIEGIYGSLGIGSEAIRKAYEAVVQAR